MRLPEIALDDRTFQELVSEARLRVGQACPEWTEHNVSDPGITLIELFAWMTEMVIYRLNRIPDKVHVALLGLVGLQMEPPSAAETLLRFRLASPPEEPVTLPARLEVGTPRTPSEPSVVFQTTAEVAVPVIEPVAYVVHRAGTFKDVGVAQGGARPKGSDQAAFGTPPMIGDALYLGFDRPLTDLLLQIDVDASPARGAGVDPEDPPLFWEVSVGDAEGWAPVDVLLDSTGGFNYGAGVVELQIGPRHTAMEVGGKRAHWVRCRLDRVTRAGLDAPPYAHPPEIYALTAAALGALVHAEHAAQAVEEALGESDGTPGQAFELRHHPILPAEEGEELHVLEPGVHALADVAARRVVRRERPGRPPLPARRGDRHRRARAPPSAAPTAAGSSTARSRPRARSCASPPTATAAGASATWRPGALIQLKESVPGVAAVTNPAPALGGVDAESLESVRRRAAMEMRTRYRAVTAEDFEYLAGAASPRVARAICPEPTTPGVVRLHLVPRVEPADRRLSLTGADAGGGAAAGRRRLHRRAPADRHDGRAAAGALPRRVRGRQPAGVAEERPRPRAGGGRPRALHVPQPAHRRLDRGPRRGLGVRPRAEPGRALRRRPRGRGRRVREDPARLRDRPRDERAEPAARRQPRDAGARRADRLRHAHRPRRAAGALSEVSSYGTNAWLATDLARRSNGDRPADAAATAPQVASARGYLRRGLPAVYHDDDFGMRFVGALETLLDPIVSVLDNLPAHFDPDIAPLDVVDMLAVWLGLEPEESWSEELRRELVRRAGELTRKRGTKAGVELALKIAFPELPLRVEDSGSVTWPTGGAEQAGQGEGARASSSTATSPSANRSKPPWPV